MNNDNKIVDQVQPQAPVAPVSPANKEMAPIGLPEIRPAGPEVKHEINQESAALGIKEIQDRPDLTSVPKELMEHSGPHVQVPPGPTGLVKIPDGKDVSNSSTWYNVLTDKTEKVIQRAMKLLGV